MVSGGGACWLPALLLRRAAEQGSRRPTRAPAPPRLKEVHPGFLEVKPQSRVTGSREGESAIHAGSPSQDTYAAKPCWHPRPGTWVPSHLPSPGPPPKC